MRARTCLLGTLLTAALVIMTGPPSSATAEEGSDAKRDVVSGSAFADEWPGKPVPARRLGDIVTNSASYGAELTVTTSFRDLTAVGDQEFTWFLLTADDPHESWNASLVVAAGKDKGRFSLIDPIANQPKCGAAVLDRPDRTVTLTIPASCLGDPDWVRVGNGVNFYSATRRYADDARRDGSVRGSWKYGPKLAAS
jgi:hypothetical protein